MKRLIGLVLAGGLAAVAWSLPAPGEPEVAATTTTVAPQPETQAFGLCPWAIVSEDLESTLTLISPVEVDATVTFPAPGEERSVEPFTLEPLVGVDFALTGLPFGGDAPAVVEFTGRPAVAGVVVQGEERIAGTTCVASVSQAWILPGGSTKAGDALELWLFNPFAEDARLTVSMTNETDYEPAPDLEALTVPAGGWRKIAIEPILPLRDSLAATIEVESGLVIPAFAQIGEQDVGVWTGVGRADVWEFPLSRVGEMEAYLVLSNPGALDVGYQVDRFGLNGSELEVASGVIAAGKHVRLPVSTISEELSGFQVRAEGRIGAVVVGHGEVARAGMPGATAVSSSWLVPGLGTAHDGRHTLWILNSSGEQVSAAYSVIDRDGQSRSGKVAVPAGQIRRVVLPVSGAAGVFVEATAPVSVAGSSEVGGAVAFLSGVPLER
jgi:hypothetical protein